MEMATVASTPPLPGAKGPRMCRAVVDLGGDILRDCLYYHIKPSVVLNYVLASRYFTNHPLNPQQMTILGNASIRGDYSDCDITLAYTLLRNLTSTNSVLRPTAGWGKIPVAVGDISLGDDIERIRELRNQMGHMATTELSDVSYIHRMKEIQDICARMDTVHKGLLISPTPRPQPYTQTLSDIQVECIDPAMERKYRQELLRMKETDKETREFFQEFRDDVNRDIAGVSREQNNLKLDMASVKHQQNTLASNIQTDLATVRKEQRHWETEVQADLTTIRSEQTDITSTVQGKLKLSKCRTCLLLLITMF